MIDRAPYRLLNAILGQPWAMLPSRFSAMLQVARLVAAGSADDRGPEAASTRQALAYPDSRPAAAGAVAVLPLHGIICQRPGDITEYFGGTACTDFAAAFRQALADPQVSAIVIDVDSPGGTVPGVEELAAEIYRGRGKKRIVAVVNALAASAAYWIASQADELVVAPSGEVGSIGVYTAHEDLSKLAEDMGVKVTLIHAGRFKVEGNPFEPLGDEARAHIQAQIDAYYDTFVKAVARGRGVTPAAAKKQYGEGRTLLAGEAKAAGMVDRVATLEETVARLATKKAPAAPRADAVGPDLVAAMLSPEGMEATEVLLETSPDVFGGMAEQIVAGEAAAASVDPTPAGPEPPPAPQPTGEAEREREALELEELSGR